MSVTFSEEQVTTALVREFIPLLIEHWEEVGINKDKIKLNFNAAFYIDGSKNGMVHCVTARDEGKLVGYTVHLVDAPPHYRDNLFAQNDVVYVHPDYRGTYTAIKMCRFAERCLRDRGVDVITLHMKVDKPFEAIARRLGYKKTEYLYTKYIGT